MKKYIGIIALLIFTTIPFSSNTFSNSDISISYDIFGSYFSVENRIIDKFDTEAIKDFKSRYKDTMLSVKYFVNPDNKYYCIQSEVVGLRAGTTYFSEDMQPCSELGLTVNSDGKLVSVLPRQLFCDSFNMPCLPTNTGSVNESNETAGTTETKSGTFLLTSAVCTLNGQVIDCSELKDKAITFLKYGVYIIFIGLGLIFFIGFIFWIFMLVHAFSNPIPDKVLWIAVIFFLSLIGAIIYYFVIKRRYQVILLEKPLSTSTSSEKGISNPIPASVQSPDITHHSL